VAAANAEISVIRYLLEHERDLLDSCTEPLQQPARVNHYDNNTATTTSSSSSRQTTDNDYSAPLLHVSISHQQTPSLLGLTMYKMINQSINL